MRPPSGSLVGVSKRFEPVDSPYLVPFDGTFKVKRSPTEPPKGERDDDDNEQALGKLNDKLVKLQARLFAENKQSLLVVFQAMDAAGKDGTIRAVLSGLNPAGVEVHDFKVPSEQELDHDFLWRVFRAAPERGRIGVFNRSHYEEVLVVRVHPEYLERQRLPHVPALDKLWEKRFESIRELEQHLARNGTTIVKLWLNVSKDEQRKRFLARTEDPDANWKFRAGDIRERGHWKEYMAAYEEALNGTSRAYAPWYAIPADDKKYMRRVVADLLVRTLERMKPKFPELTDEERAEMAAAVKELEKEDA
jgi:PPK2 family polyphosphate:nucleotide phosphotransferase